jgi:CheY-like chemotaxis protein
LLDARYLLGQPAEALDQVRQLRKQFPALEVLALCDGDAHAARVQGLGARFIRCILKPVRLEELTHLPEGDLERSANLASLARAVTKPVPLHSTPAQKAADGAPHLPPLRILVGEDNPVNRLVIQAIIERLGHHGTVIPDGARLVAELQKGEPYDLILMDCNMPGLDGYEASQRIRELLPDRGALPIVAVTANAPTDVYDKCIASGMNDVVGKPVTADLLRDVFNRYARARQSS